MHLTGDNGAYDAGEYGGDQRAPDPASMLAALEQQLDRRTLALALGVRQRELDELEAGREPDAETAKRLRLLFETSRKADLSDPDVVAAALLGVSALRGPAAGLRLLTRGPYRWILFLFVAFDALLVVGVAAYALFALQ